MLLGCSQSPSIAPCHFADNNFLSFLLSVLVDRMHIVMRLGGRFIIS